jgi:hypothetical protein
MEPNVSTHEEASVVRCSLVLPTFHQLALEEKQFPAKVALGRLLTVALKSLVLLIHQQTLSEMDQIVAFSVLLRTGATMEIVTL